MGDIRMGWNHQKLLPSQIACPFLHSCSPVPARQLPSVWFVARHPQIASLSSPVQSRWLWCLSFLALRHLSAAKMSDTGAECALDALEGAIGGGRNGIGK